MKSYEYKYKPVGSDYPVKFNPYWNNQLRAESLQRMIIIYSISYYELNNTIIDDKKYDAISHQLLWYMETSEVEELEKTQYWYCMSDYDGSTGFDIYSRLTEIDRVYLRHLANVILGGMKQDAGKRNK